LREGESDCDIGKRERAAAGGAAASGEQRERVSIESGGRRKQ
jgi:hypothetical protein